MHRGSELCPAPFHPAVPVIAAETLSQIAKSNTQSLTKHVVCRCKRPHTCSKCTKSGECASQGKIVIWWKHSCAILVVCGRALSYSKRSAENPAIIKNIVAQRCFESTARISRCCRSILKVTECRMWWHPLSSHQV